MRLFLAINLPSEVRRDIFAATLPLRDCAPELSWIAEKRLHLTLKFLGEQSPDQLGAMHSALARVARSHRELLMVIGGVGAFPNFRRARVVWMAVGPDPRLELLHHDVEVACEQLGLELAARAFRPHVTLARVKAPLDEERARRLRRIARKMDVRAEFVVQSIDLMQSDLSTAGPEYAMIASAALRSD